MARHVIISNIDMIVSYFAVNIAFFSGYTRLTDSNYVVLRSAAKRFARPDQLVSTPLCICITGPSISCRFGKTAQRFARTRQLVGHLVHVLL